MKRQCITSNQKILFPIQINLKIFWTIIILKYLTWLQMDIELSKNRKQIDVLKKWVQVWDFIRKINHLRESPLVVHVNAFYLFMGKKMINTKYGLRMFRVKEIIIVNWWYFIYRGIWLISHPKSRYNCDSGTTAEMYESFFQKENINIDVFCYKNGFFVLCVRDKWVFHDLSTKMICWSTYFEHIPADEKRHNDHQRYVGTYRSLSQHGYIHLTVNYSRGFVNPANEAHTIKIESWWDKAKHRNKTNVEITVRYWIPISVNSCGLKNRKK